MNQYCYIMLWLLCSTPVIIAMKEEKEEEKRSQKVTLGHACGTLSNISDKKFEDLLIRFAQAVQNLNHISHLQVGEHRKEITLKELDFYGQLYSVESEFTSYKNKIDNLIQTTKSNFFQLLLDFCEHKKRSKLRQALAENTTIIFDTIKHITNTFLNSNTQKQQWKKDQKMTDHRTILNRIQLIRPQYTRLFLLYLNELIEIHIALSEKIKRIFSLQPKQEEAKTE